jgi:hypothetical protein
MAAANARARRILAQARRLTGLQGRLPETKTGASAIETLSRAIACMRGRPCQQSTGASGGPEEYFDRPASLQEVRAPVARILDQTRPCGSGEDVDRGLVIEAPARGNCVEGRTTPLRRGAPNRKQTASLITFTRVQTALTPATAPLWQYLNGATFVISDPEGTMAEAWIDHPAAAPILGPCPGDATHEPLGNVLIYNDVAVPNGRNV